MISADDDAFQSRLLPGVSRTFALTIPQLPLALRSVVTHAYLLCRIVDTLEDSPLLTAAEKRTLAGAFACAVEQPAQANAFVDAVATFAARHPHLAERALLQQAAHVIRIGEGYNLAQQHALKRCIRTMADGMAHFAGHQSTHGLKNLNELNEYCYYVAGVVGELLTELFCDYRSDLAPHKDRLMPLAISFGQGLQMTNILKDIWDDRDRNTCWLPREVFAAHGFDLDQLAQRHCDPHFLHALRELVGIAHGHLENALTYVEMLPANEPGLRRFCLWALGMAVLTLRKIHRHADFADSRAVKITRNAVHATIAVTSLVGRYNIALRWLFRSAAHGLPGHTGLLNTQGFTPRNTLM
jgi:farnesyl-diphosphate farnesyltransferase